MHPFWLWRKHFEDIWITTEPPSKSREIAACFGRAATPADRHTPAHSSVGMQKFRHRRRERRRVSHSRAPWRRHRKGTRGASRRGGRPSKLSAPAAGKPRVWPVSRAAVEANAQYQLLHGPGRGHIHRRHQSKIRQTVARLSTDRGDASGAHLSIGNPRRSSDHHRPTGPSTHLSKLSKSFGNPVLHSILKKSVSALMLRGLRCLCGASISAYSVSTFWLTGASRAAPVVLTQLRITGCSPNCPREICRAHE